MIFPCSPKKTGGDQEHEQREKLPPRKGTGERCVGFPKIFADDAHNGVKNKEAAGRHTGWFFEP